MNHNIRSAKNFQQYFDFFQPFLLNFSLAHVYCKIITANSCIHRSSWLCPSLRVGNADHRSSSVGADRKV